MLDDLGPKFLAALVETAVQRLGEADGFVASLREAAKATDPALVRRLLDSLAPADADALLAATHRRLSHDMRAVLANLGAPSGAKPN
jgi:hypothetical protein